MLIFWCIRYDENRPSIFSCVFVTCCFDSNGRCVGTGSVRWREEASQHCLWINYWPSHHSVGCKNNSKSITNTSCQRITVKSITCTSSQKITVKSIRGHPLSENTCTTYFCVHWFHVCMWIKENVIYYKLENFFHSKHLGNRHQY